MSNKWLKTIKNVTKKYTDRQEVLKEAMKVVPSAEKRSRYRSVSELRDNIKRINNIKAHNMTPLDNLGVSKRLEEIMEPGKFRVVNKKKTPSIKTASHGQEEGKKYLKQKYYDDLKKKARDEYIKENKKPNYFKKKYDQMREEAIDLQKNGSKIKEKYEPERAFKDGTILNKMFIKNPQSFVPLLDNKYGYGAAIGITAAIGIPAAIKGNQIVNNKMQLGEIAADLDGLPKQVSQSRSASLMNSSEDYSMQQHVDTLGADGELALALHHLRGESQFGN